MVSYCSPLNDRLLTKSLIKLSNCSSSSFHNFVNQSEWTDGLDLWSSNEIIRKNHLSKRYLDFDKDLGLHLPRNEKVKSSAKTDQISSTNLTTNLFPKRLTELFQKQKDLFKTNPSKSSEDIQPLNSIQQSNPTRIKSTVVRFPFRQVECSSHSNKSKRTCQSSNPNKFQILINEQLNNLIPKETIHFNCKGTLLQTPSKEKQKKIIRSTSATDQISIIERYHKLRRVFINPSFDKTTTTTNHQSTLVYRGSSTLDLTVTPLNRSLSQSVSRCSLNQENEDQKSILLKRPPSKGFISTSQNSLNKSSLDNSTCSMTNYSRHHRPPSKTQFEKAHLSQLLPTVISEKCLLIPISTYRYY